MTIFTAGQNITAAGLQNLEKNFASGSAPGTPVTGQLWYDTGTSILKVYNGSSWIAAGTGSGGGANVIVKDEGSTLTSAVTSIDFVGSGVTATNVGDVVTVTIAGGGGGGGATVSSTEPGSPSDGALWYDTVNAKLYVYISASTVWVETSPSGGGAGGGAGGGVFDYQVFSGNGTFTVPTGVTSVVVTMWGGGGGGAGTSSSNSGYTKSGGQGGFGKAKITGLTPGQTITVTVGAGGAGGASDNGAGSAGGTTSFGTYATATGGAGGSGSGGSQQATAGIFTTTETVWYWATLTGGSVGSVPSAYYGGCTPVTLYGGGAGGGGMSGGGGGGWGTSGYVGTNGAGGSSASFGESGAAGTSSGSGAGGGVSGGAAGGAAGSGANGGGGGGAGGVVVQW